MIEITDDIVVIEFPEDEYRRWPKPEWKEELPEGASWLDYIIPEKYKGWHIRWSWKDMQTLRWVIVLTEYPVLIQQDVIQSDEGWYQILESMFTHK